MENLGKWITNGTASPFYARKVFRVEKEVLQATARVCGLGQFVFYVNGRRAGDHELDPGWTNYHKLIEYVSFDVTELLQKGENVLGAEVGNGWFIKTDEHYTFSFPAFMPPNPNPYKPFGKSLVLALKLEVEYADGTSEVMTADESFLVKKHPVVMSNVYGSETIDGGLTQKGWAAAGFDAGDWENAVVLDKSEAPQGMLMEQFQPAVKVIRTYVPRYLRGVFREVNAPGGRTEERLGTPDGKSVEGSADSSGKAAEGTGAPGVSAERPADSGGKAAEKTGAPGGKSAEGSADSGGKAAEKTGAPGVKSAEGSADFGGKAAEGTEAPGVKSAEGSADPGGRTAEESGDLSGKNGESVCGASGGTGRILREIYDFGQNMSGILEAELYGKKGDMIKIYPAEKLGPDGDVDQVAKNWVNLDSCITFIVGEDNAWENFRMKFTYFAGRYAAVEKYGSTQLRLRSFRAHAITSAWKTDGSFTCDDVRYEQIYRLVEKAVEANMLGVHTDCPTIERFAWQEPNHLMAPSIMYMKDGRKLWEKFLLDMRTDQHTAEDYFYDFGGNKVYPGEGLMPSQCPCYIPNVLPVPGMGSFYDIIPWGSTCILGTWWHYQFYGDEQIIRDNYRAGMKYLAYLKTKITEDGFICHGLGDWGNPENNLLRENVETAFLYADASVMERFARILGAEEDARELEAFARSVKENYNQKLLVYDEERGYWCYRAWDHPGENFLTQASQALPLFWGMVPEEREADVVKAFRAALEEKQAFVSGEVGLPYIIQTAGKYEMDDLIARFILRDTHPSYYAFVLDGETTLGEYWETNPRSHCHDMMGHIVEWYYNGIAGILPEKPGFSRVKICPCLPETIHEFTCRYESASGPVQVHVKEEQEEILLEIRAAEGIVLKADPHKLEGRGKPVRVMINEAY